MFSDLVSAVAFSMEFILIWKTEVATEDWLDVIYLQVRHNGVAFFLTAVDENWMNWKCSYRTEISGCFHNFIRLLLTVIVIMYKVIIYIYICNIYIYILYIYIYIYNNFFPFCIISWICHLPALYHQWYHSVSRLFS